MNTGTLHPHVVFSLQNISYAVSAEKVNEMLPIPAVASVPLAPEFTRGLMNIRGTVIPLFDLRKFFGLRTNKEEMDLLQLDLEQRKRDHLNWLEELKSCVAENREFTLQRDPHKCAFGKWYDSYTTDDLVLSGILRQFDMPHKAVHALAARIEKHVHEGKTDLAISEIKKLEETELQTMLNLFEATHNRVHQAINEIAMVFQSDTKRFATTVDKVLAVENLKETGIPVSEEMRSSTMAAGIESMGKRSGNDEVVLLFNPDMLMHSLNS